jgi:hypothetical protein
MRLAMSTKTAAPRATSTLVRRPATLPVLAFQPDQATQDEGGGQADGGIEQGFEIDVGDDLHGTSATFMGPHEGRAAQWCAMMPKCNRDMTNSG